MMFVFPSEQRVLTREEYAQLGYIEIGKVPSSSNDEPLSEIMAFPAYRADTKKEFAIDVGLGIAKLTYTASTGGLLPAVRTTLGYVTSLLS